MTDAAHRVLVVDDEFASLEVLALLLTGEGFSVATASNGEEALARLAENTVDLLIADYKMPKMDGITLCERMLEDVRLQPIPVILTSGTPRHSLPRPSNVAAFFSKPVQFDALLRMVREILARTVTQPRA